MGFRHGCRRETPITQEAFLKESGENRAGGFRYQKVVVPTLKADLFRKEFFKGLVEVGLGDLGLREPCVGIWSSEAVSASRLNQAGPHLVEYDNLIYLKLSKKKPTKTKLPPLDPHTEQRKVSYDWKSDFQKLGLLWNILIWFWLDWREWW